MTGKLRRTIKQLSPWGRRPGEATGRQKLFLRRPTLNSLAYWWTKRALSRRTSAERTVNDVLDTVLEYEPGCDPYRVTALQTRDELEEFVRFLGAREPETALEIGMFQGGTLYVWARAISSLRQVTCVDKPAWNEMVHRRRRGLYPAFSEDVDIDIIYGDSHTDGTYEDVAESIGDGVDFLFIDGDHSYEGVKRDFEMYSELVGDGGIIAFHDIQRHAKDEHEKEARLRQVDGLRERHVSVGLRRWMGVSEFWNEIQDEYPTREFLTHPRQMGGGIGVVEL